MSGKTRIFYEFENFCLDAENSSLWQNERLVAISPKALETLTLLVKKRGEILSREELLETVWKDTFVEDTNINYTISLLRKTLDNKDLIQTVPRRGYRFVSEVREVAENGSRKTFDSVLPIVETPAVFEITSAEKESPVRWILISVFLICVVFVTSFAYLRREIKPVSEPDNPQTANQEAKQAFTRGKMILARRNVENREEKAIDEFQNAVTLDPTFAAGYAGLAEGLSSFAAKLSGADGADKFAKARAAAEKSLALDPRLSEGYLARGWIKRQADWDWIGAESDLRTAILLEPKNATAHQRLALLLCNLGRLDEALAEIEIANELDPVADYIIGARFPILEARRDYDSALKESEQFQRENKSNSAAARAYATFLYHKGDYPKVIEISEQLLQKDSTKNSFALLSLLAAAFQKTGQLENAEEKLKHLEIQAQADTKALYSLAMNYAELGRADEALSHLEKCFTHHEERMCWIKIEPRFENLRADERFQKLIKKMNL